MFLICKNVFQFQSNYFFWRGVWDFRGECDKYIDKVLFNYNNEANMESVFLLMVYIYIRCFSMNFFVFKILRCSYCFEFFIGFLFILYLDFQEGLAFLVGVFRVKVELELNMFGRYIVIVLLLFLLEGLQV